MVRFSAIANFLPAVRRALNVGVAETRACLRVDPAQLAFVDRFMHGRWGAALRIAVIVLPWWLLIFPGRFSRGLASAAFPNPETTAQKLSKSFLWYLLLEPATLHFACAFVVAMGVRRALASKQWQSEAATIPGTHDALFRAAIRSVLWIAGAGAVAYYVNWSVYRMMGGGLPMFTTVAGRAWANGGPGSWPLVLAVEGLTHLRNFATVTLSATLLVAALLRLRWPLLILVLSSALQLRFYADPVVSIFMVRTTASYMLSSLPASLFKLALAAMIVGHLHMVYDREGPGIGRRWR